MRFYFSAWPMAEYQGRALTRQRAQSRLLSFYYLRTCPPGFLERFARDGYVLSDERERIVAFLAPSSIRSDK